MLQPSQPATLFPESRDPLLRESHEAEVRSHFSKPTARSKPNPSLPFRSKSVPLFSLLLTFACNLVLAGSIPAAAPSNLKSIQKRHPSSTSPSGTESPSSGQKSADELQLKSICFPAQFVQQSTIRDFKRWALTSTKGRDEVISPSGVLTTSKDHGFPSLDGAFGAHPALGGEEARVRSKRVAVTRSRMRKNRGHPKTMKPKRSRTKRRIPKHLSQPDLDGHHFLRRDGKHLCSSCRGSKLIEIILFFRVSLKSERNLAVLLPFQGRE